MLRLSSCSRCSPQALIPFLAFLSIPWINAPAEETGHAWKVDDLKHTASGKPLTGEPGRRPDSLLSRAYGELLVDDTQAILTAPLHWDREEWLVAGGLTSLVAMSSALDRQIWNEAQEHRTRSLNSFAKTTQQLGAGGSFVVLGIFEGYGYWAKDSKAKAVAMDGLTASIIASGLVAPALKWGFGRVRPNEASHVYDFRPFSGNFSFPSGHATQAFAVASVISAHYDRWWVTGLSYGAAGLVGYSRIEQNAHFASDVVAGAIIGTVIGRTIVHRHEQPREGAFKLSPFIDRRASGLMIQKNF